MPVNNAANTMFGFPIMKASSVSVTPIRITLKKTRALKSLNPNVMNKPK
jgi:hypothetical protein